MGRLINHWLKRPSLGGNTGGVGGHTLLKSDNGTAVKALKDAAGKLLGGSVVPKNPQK